MYLPSPFLIYRLVSLNGQMAKSKYNDFRDLEVWQRCRDIRKKVWQLCKNFPKEEKYRLSDQMIRALRSSTASWMVESNTIWIYNLTNQPFITI